MTEVEGMDEGVDGRDEGGRWHRDERELNEVVTWLEHLGTCVGACVHKLSF